MKNKKDKVSIVIPVYYNEGNIKPLYADIKKKIIDKKLFDYEIVMVDDGSGDNSWEEINKIAKNDKNVVPIKLSRNFGSHAADFCGLMNATGDCVVNKGADLQEPTEMIIDMYKKWKEGFNVVLAVREDREDKSLFSDIYYYLTKKFCLDKMPQKGFDTYLIDRKVVETLRNFDEKNSAVTLQILWAGFKTTEVKYIRRAREIGTSRWTLKKKIKLVMDTFFSFSTFPITLVSVIGALSCFGSFIWALIKIIEKLTIGIDTPGYTSLFVFQLFSFGTIMITMGIIGNYLWRCFDAVRGRPVYIIEEKKKTK